MASAAMAVQDNRGGPQLSMVQDVVNEASLITRLHDDTDPQKNKQFLCRNGYHPKVRKPYTITKQRERWTNEEHNKFLEALKMYGRAWRNIEEYIGTKTAVQIRSHAQKFFSKVEREAGGDTTALGEPIEIPPPRPKRRPTHPYPRKMVGPLNKDPLTLKQPIRSSSLDSPPSELETQSPTSVLSAVSADRSDSMTSNLSLSPASQDVGLQSVKVLFEPFSSSEDSSSLTANPQMSSATYETLLMDDLGKEKCTRSLKLFGTTVLLTEYPPSPQSGETSKVLQDAREKRTFQLVKTNVNMWADFAQVNLEVSDRLPIQKEVSKQVGTGCSESLQLGSMRAFMEPECKDIQEKRIWTEVSSSGFGGHNSEKVFDSETLGWQLHSVNTELLLALDPGSWEEKPSPEKRTKGFVPYKKRVAARDDLCSTVTGNEREEKRIRLWL